MLFSVFCLKGSCDRPLDVLQVGSLMVSMRASVWQLGKVAGRSKQRNCAASFQG